MQFLDEIKVCPDFLQRLAGFALTGSTKEEKFFFFYGSGANGKTQFVEQLQGIMGAYSRKSPVSTFINKRYADHPTELVSLKAALGAILRNPPEQALERGYYSGLNRW